MIVVSAVRRQRSTITAMKTLGDFFMLKKKIGHIDNIPGGKRFWKVGKAYCLRYPANLYPFKIELTEVSKKRHRYRNIRWEESMIHLYMAEAVEAKQLFILLRPPCYKTILDENHTMTDCYQIKVLCGEKIGWLKLSAKLSPRQYCYPVK